MLWNPRTNIPKVDERIGPGNCLESTLERLCGIDIILVAFQNDMLVRVHRSSLSPHAPWAVLLDSFKFLDTHSLQFWRNCPLVMRSTGTSLRAAGS